MAELYTLLKTNQGGYKMNKSIVECLKARIRTIEKYLNDTPFNNVVVIDEFSGNMALTVNQALDLCNINMDEYAEAQGWDGYDWNSLEIRFKDQ